MLEPSFKWLGGIMAVGMVDLQTLTREIQKYS